MYTRIGVLAGVLAAVLVTATVAGTSWAQSNKRGGAPEAPKSAPAKVAKPPMPDNTQLTLLTQNAMAALAQANATGNYSVLHALSAPSFQKVNSPTKLANIFAGVRKANVDIAPVILFQPILTTRPSIDDKGMLRLTGYYNTQPQNVLFEIIYVASGGQWRINGLSVRTRPASQAQAAPPAASSKKR